MESYCVKGSNLVFSFGKFTFHLQRGVFLLIGWDEKVCLAHLACNNSEVQKQSGLVPSAQLSN